MPAGRPSIYTEELAETICRRMANGESLRKICMEEGMPNADTVYEWRRKNQEFSDKYARAREDQQQSKVDEAEEIARRSVAGEVEPAAARVMIDLVKWTAARLAPKDFGDKLSTELTGKGGGPIRTENVVVSSDEAFRAYKDMISGEGGEQ